MIEDKLCILACEIYNDELKVILNTGEFPDVEIGLFPQVCPNPSKTSEKLDYNLDKYRTIYKYVDCLYDKCNFSVKSNTDVPKLNEMSKMYQCLEIIADRDLLNYLGMNERGYIVTPGWLRRWKEHINYWKFDKKNARQFFQESMSRVFLLDTGIHDNSRHSLDEFSDFIGLPCECIEVGLDHIKNVLSQQVIKWRTARNIQTKEMQLLDMNQQLSNYKMMCQVAGTLGKLDDESKVIVTATDFIKILTGVNRIIYIPVADGIVRDPVPKVAVSKAEQDVISEFFSSTEDYSWHSSDTGFIIRLRYLSETIGLLYIKDALFKERLPEYLNLVLAITNPVSLAISNSRYYERLKKAQDLLAIQASTDSLTGIANRHAIIEQLEIEISRAERERRPLSVAMMDIDHFKKVNDTYGHTAGDTVLAKIAEQARSAIRPYDYIGRIGGEEFLIVIPGTAVTDAVSICERILSRIEGLTIKSENHNIQVTVSLGVSTYTGKEKIDADILISAADIALYRAKKGGRNRVVHSDIPTV